GAIGAVGAEVGRIVAENVLVADVVGDLVADVVNILHVFREIGEAAGGVGDFLEGFFGFGFGFALLFAQQADGVDDRVGLLNLFDGFFERVAAGVVFAVGDDQKDVLIFVRLFEVIERTDDGVVQGGRAAGVDALQRFFEFGNAGREIL